MDDLEVQLTIDALDTDIFQLRRKLERLCEKKANLQTECKHTKCIYVTDQDETQKVCVICRRVLLRHTYGGTYRG